MAIDFAKVNPWPVSIMYTNKLTDPGENRVYML